MNRHALVALVLISGCSGPRTEPGRPVAIADKKFTESIILAEMGVQLARQTGIAVERRDLGSTSTVWQALTVGDVDAYVDYTGTITHEILKTEPRDLAVALAAHGVRMSKPLGFRNNYALGMRRDVAAAKGIRSISDLRNHPDLRFGFTHEFIDRSDGWRGLRQRYGLPQPTPTGFEHSLAYHALVEGAIDVMELYTTDAEIIIHDLVVLDDDREFFPPYEAVWLYREDLEQRHPGVVRQLRRLEGMINEDEMRRLNARVKQNEANETRAAAEFLDRKLGLDKETVIEEGLGERLLQTTWEHLKLVAPSMLAAIMVAVPLGVLAFRRPTLGRGILAATGVLQTIPSLAVLLFMIPVMMWLLGQGIGAPPAIAALFLYSLLPIVRNTHAGLTGIPASLRESAEALGLPPAAILWRIELPLAAPMILAGIRTAAVINVGTATLGGLIGAGGYGRPILRGLDKMDVPLMLEGAIPAALMALAVEAIFGLIERAIARPARS